MKSFRKGVTILMTLGFLLVVSSFIPAVHAAGSITVGSGPGGSAYASSTKDVYILNNAGGTVSVIDPSSNKVVNTIGMCSCVSLVYAASTDSIIAIGGDWTVTSYGPLSPGPSYITHGAFSLTTVNFFGAAYASSNSQVYIADAFNNVVQIFDPSSNGYGTPISVGNNPQGVAFDQSNGYVYASNYNDGTVSVIDTSSNTVIHTVSAGGNPDGLVYAPSSNDVYVANFGSNTVTVIDASNNVPGATINVGSHPVAVAYASSNNDIYVTNEGDNTVSVIDTSSNQVVQTVSVGSTPDGVVFSPDNSDVYTSNYFSGSVSVIDASTSISGTITTALTSLGSSVSGGFTSVESSLTGLSSNLASDFSSLSSQVTSLSGTLSTDFSSLTSQISSLNSGMTSGFSGVTTEFSTLSATLASDFNSLSSQISNIGVKGPTVGTSNDAAVVTTPSFSTLTSFSNSASSWTLVSPATAVDRVLSGYTVSSTAFNSRNAVLYVSLTNTPGSSSATYAIPLGNVGLLTTPSGQLRFPFHIPSGSSVYVQVVSSSVVSVTLQLQLVTLPINP